jgi:hypothetical protein
MKVSWDDEIPNIWKIKNVPNHQPAHNTHDTYHIGKANHPPPNSYLGFAK